jgi:hypothetical protein
VKTISTSNRQGTGVVVRLTTIIFDSQLSKVFTQSPNSWTTLKSYKDESSGTNYAISPEKLYAYCTLELTLQDR